MMKQMIALSVLLLIICNPLAALTRQGTLQLTDADRKAIISSALNLGLEDLKETFKKPSILDNCQTLTLRDEEVVFLSTKNLDRNLVPKIEGIHFEFMNQDEIKAEVVENKRHCYLAFDRFEIIGSKVVVNLVRHLDYRHCPKCILYVYEEGVVYEFSQVDGKWQGKYKNSYSMES
ncbi:MAG: hypothetical protein ACR2LC_16645 [Pyrinomonadaceae bacterium]